MKLQKLKQAAMGAFLALMSAYTFAADEIDPAPLVNGINSAKPVVIAIAGAIFAVIGLVVAINYGKRAAK